MLVEAFGEGFGKAVCQRLEQDIRIIVMLRLEAGDMRIDPVNSDREAADPVARRIDEIGEAIVGAVAALGDLLAEHGEANSPSRWREGSGVGKTTPCIPGPPPAPPASGRENIILLAPTRPHAAHALRGEPLLGDDHLQHRIGIGLQRAGAFADHIVIKDRGVIPRQFPAAEERRPVEHFEQVGKVPVLEHVQSWLRGGRGLL